MRARSAPPLKDALRKVARDFRALATNLSLIATAKRHKRDPLELIKTVLLKAGDTSFDALRSTTRTVCPKTTPRGQTQIR